MAKKEKIDLDDCSVKDSDRAALKKAHRMFRSKERRLVKIGRNISVWMKKSEATPENFEKLKTKYCGDIRVQ